MHAINPQALQDFLDSRVPPHRLRQDMILFYVNQVPMAAVWLIQGAIQLEYENGKLQLHIAKGLYFLDEMSKEKGLKASAILRANSQVWFVTRSEINDFLLTV